MKKAHATIDRDFFISRIDNRLHGALLEHLGRAIYQGIYEPGHPKADAFGFRTDVMELVRMLGVSVLRYPGGNFVSGFNWEDSIGPREQRPRRLDLAWFTTETNEVGLHEFCHWARKVGSEVMYAVNLGTRGVDAARSVVEYANHPGGTYWSDLRIQNGERQPFGIKLWCLGNEMDADWQMGHKTAYEYGRIANEAAKVMKWVDPTIEVVACGSSHRDMPTFGTWEREMLEQCYDNIDYISLHRYYGNEAGDTPSFLARSADLEAFIHTVTAICDAVGGSRKSKKRLHLSLDEWNVWYHSKEQDEVIKKQDRWGRSLPLLEDVYNFEDALLCASLLMALLRNADRVKIACLAQLVNVIAPIMTRPGGGVWKQTIFWPFYHVARLGRGKALQAIVDTPLYDCALAEGVPVVDLAAVENDDGQIVVFAVNRDLTEAVDFTLDLRGCGPLRLEEHIVMHSDDVKAVNTEADPHRVEPVSVNDGRFDAGTLEIRLPALSWNVIRLSGERQDTE